MGSEMCIRDRCKLLARSIGAGPTSCRQRKARPCVVPCSEQIKCLEPAPVVRGERRSLRLERRQPARRCAKRAYDPAKASKSGALHSVPSALDWGHWPAGNEMRCGALKRILAEARARRMRPRHTKRLQHALELRPELGPWCIWSAAGRELPCCTACCGGKVLHKHSVFVARPVHAGQVTRGHRHAEVCAEKEQDELNVLERPTVRLAWNAHLPIVSRAARIKARWRNARVCARITWRRISEIRYRHVWEQAFEPINLDIERSEQDALQSVWLSGRRRQDQLFQGGPRAARMCIAIKCGLA